MNCKYCHKPIYVARICPHCMEYYCAEHYEPSKHFCTFHKEPRVDIENEKANVPSWASKVCKFLFITALFTVVCECALRAAAWSRGYPFFEENLYVAIMSLFLPPYFSAFLVVSASLLILFAVRRFSKFDGVSNDYADVLRFTFSAGAYLTIMVIFGFSSLNWMAMLF
ncbi:MAG: hypothetical protein ACP5IM_01810 [Candidatus Bathyarchaeia archaeon]